MKIPERLWPTYALALRDLSTLKVDNAAPCLILPDDAEQRAKNQRVEAWLRGFISFTDLCTLNGWEAAERRATLEGLGITLPEWNERAKPLAWTKEAPTESGFYWRHDPELFEGRPWMVYVSTINEKHSMRVFTGSWADAPEGGLWAGPLPMPMVPGATPEGPPEAANGTQWHGKPSGAAKITHMARFDDERLD